MNTSRVQNTTKVVLFNKPFNVLSQFRAEENRQTLADFIHDPSLRIAGRLDADSEGLLLLTNSGTLNHQLTAPNKRTFKYYWVQVEGDITPEAIQQLQHGVLLKDGLTLPAHVKRIATPEGLWERHPPIRTRLHIPTSWLEIGIREGRNRQIRRMVAAVGFPCLRLIRFKIGAYTLDTLQPGQHTQR